MAFTEGSETAPERRARGRWDEAASPRSSAEDRAANSRALPPCRDHGGDHKEAAERRQPKGRAGRELSPLFAFGPGRWLSEEISQSAMSALER